MSELTRMALKAKQELEMTARAFALMEQAMLEDIADSGPEQSVRREQLYHGVRALRMVAAALTAAGSEADMEAYRISLAEAGFGA